MTAILNLSIKAKEKTKERNKKYVINTEKLKKTYGGIFVMKIIGLDVGFGWTKVKTDDKEFKFPSWISHAANFSMSEIEPVVVDGKEYFVGEDASFGAGKIEIADIDTLINYLPVFEKYVKRILGIDEAFIVSGLPPKYYKTHKDKLKTGLVAVQGVGVLVDIDNSFEFTKGDRVLILDVGFNTVDYVLALYQGDKWKKAGLNSIADLGVMQAVKIFKDIVPSEVAGKAKDWSVSKWIKAFEDKSISLMGERIDLSNYFENAVSRYIEMLQKRISEEVGNQVFEFEHIVLAGGGANILKNSFERSVIVPESPELSNARGYYQLGVMAKENES